MIKIITELIHVTKGQLMVILRERWYVKEKNRKCLSFPKRNERVPECTSVTVRSVSQTASQLPTLLSLFLSYPAQSFPIWGKANGSKIG